jgi:hypothetical protein
MPSRRCAHKLPVPCRAMLRLAMVRCIDLCIDLPLLLCPNSAGAWPACREGRWQPARNQYAVLPCTWVMQRWTACPERCASPEMRCSCTGTHAPMARGPCRRSTPAAAANAGLQPIHGVQAWPLPCPWLSAVNGCPPFHSQWISPSLHCRPVRVLSPSTLSSHHADPQHSQIRKSATLWQRQAWHCPSHWQ